jgi:S-DNA-T family DNA segregation ATPase FtsK/SpoIIIE
MRTDTGGSSSRGREVAGILVFAIALFLLGSVASLQLGSGTLMGPCGFTVGLGLYALLGVSSYLLAIGLGAVAIGLLRGQPVRFRSAATAGFVGGAIALSVLFHLALGRHRLHGYSSGGLLGEYGAELLRSLIGTAGTILVGVVGLALATVACTPITMRGIGRGIAWVAGTVGRGLFRTVRFGGKKIAGAAVAVFPSGGDDDEIDEDEELAPVAPTIHEQETMALRSKKKSDDDTDRGARDESAATVGEEGEAPIVIEAQKPRKKKAKADEAGVVAVAGPSELTAKLEDVPPVAIAPAVATVAAAPIAEVATIEDRTVPSEAPVEMTPAPAIIAPEPRKTPPELPVARPPEPSYDNYQLPDLSLLNFDDPARGDLDRQAMLDLAVRLEKTLADYGVKGRVSEIHPGPVVTMYEFVPQAGTKLSKITALSNDLAMTLEALKVRIVAPIPGKAAVGIEVPNKARDTVYLKEIIGDESFARAKSKLTLALGKDIAGRPVSVDLARMPHLLIAGTTGSGKSVSVNGMICSILFNATPEDVKMIMIDPKMLELSIYEGIPHLLLPVVTDPKKANLALRWAVDEMERRYDLISKAGVRDIASYNKKILKLTEGTPAPAPKVEEKKIKVMVSGPDGEREIEVDATEEAVSAAGGVVTKDVLDDISAARAAVQQKNEAAKKEEEPQQKLPYIVVIIDEFADLMMVASKEVETSVARIAQKARAAGIHLLLATQRPSVDVITGLIKANFPSRIAFQVASKIDARTILDQQGAESLLGMGDMLFTDRGLALKRIHGPLVTDVEIREVVEFLKKQGKPVYDLDILKPRGDEGGEEGEGEDMSDEMYDQAVALVAETRQASISMIQRRLRVGYNRAARMVERMEREGIVGAADGAKPREVLISSHSVAS